MAAIISENVSAAERCRNAVHSALKMEYYYNDKCVFMHVLHDYLLTSKVWFTVGPRLSGPRLTWSSKYRDIFTNKSSKYPDPDNRWLGFFFDYLELFLDLVIPIIEDLLYYEQRICFLKHTKVSVWNTR